MKNLKEIIESILFVSGDAVDFNDIASKLEVNVKTVEKAVKELQNNKETAKSGVLVQIFNGKAQLCSNSEYSECVEAVLNPIKEKALTRAVLEVAAIIAYKQPVTRLDIEHVRGVSSDYSINILMENNLIEVVGRKDAIGKPLLYATTDEFLKRFNMESVNDLPDYEELISRIQVIKTEDSLFDYSNMPSTEMQPENANDKGELSEIGEHETVDATSEDKTNINADDGFETQGEIVAAQTFATENSASEHLATHQTAAHSHSSENKSLEELQTSELENILAKVAGENADGDIALSDLSDEELDEFLENYKIQTELKDSAIKAEKSDEFKEFEGLLSEDDDDYLSEFDSKVI